MSKYYKLQIGFVPQKEWNTPMWLEMSFGAVGGGVFIISVLLGFQQGALIGFLLGAAGKGLFLLADLGKPMRFLRVFSRPFNSWISFGSWAFLLFCLSGLVYLITELYGEGSTGAFFTAMQYLSLISAVILIIYDGFFLGTSTGVSAWNSSVLPVLFGTGALAVGSISTLVLQILITGTSTMPPVLIFIAFLVLIISCFSYVQGLMKSVQGSKISGKRLLSGDLKTVFVLLSVVIGMIVPFLISVFSLWGTAIASTFWIIGALCALIGIIALRASVLKAGVYSPVS